MTTRKGVVKPTSFKAHRRPKYLDVLSKGSSLSVYNFNATWFHANYLSSRNLDAKTAFAVNTNSTQVLLTETLPYMSIISPQWLSLGKL
jgi:hypothetical protein